MFKNILFFLTILIIWFTGFALFPINSSFFNTLIMPYISFNFTIYNVLEILNYIIFSLSFYKIVTCYEQTNDYLYIYIPCLPAT